MKRLTICIFGATVFSASLLLLSPSAQGAPWSVTSQAEFQAALTAAASNGEADTITIPASTTITLTTTLAYPWPANENFPLIIEGTNSSSSRIEGGPGFSGDYGLLYIDHPNPAGTYPYPDDNAHVTVRNIGFHTGRGYYAGGLYVSTYDGDITVQNCNFSSNSASDGWAGGLSAWSARGLVTVSDNIFISNQVTSLGWDGAAGAYAYAWTGGLVVENNNFANNDVLSSGSSYAAGGLYAETSAALTMTGNTFNLNDVSDHSNSSGAGGAYVYGGDPTNLTGNIFTNNTAAGASGGVDLSAVTAVMTGNTFINNTGDPTNGSGGGAQVWSNNQVTMTANTFTGNSAYEGGGAYVSSPALVMVNNVFSSNTAHYPSDVLGAGGLRVTATGSATLTNNTITGNSAATGNGGGLFLQTVATTTSLDIYNNVVWGNTAAGAGGDIRQRGSYGTATISHNDYATLSFDMTPTLVSNISSPPLWDADFYPQFGSPCIDSGDNGAPSLPATDKNGNPRIDGGAVDMGAYEFASSAALTMAASPLAGGTVTPPSGTVAIGTPVAITATAGAGYRFDGWSASPPGNATFGDVNRSSTTVTISGAVTATAAFISVTDSDSDGIDDAIDGTWNGAVFTDESGSFSSSFTDEPSGGTTFGAITSRADLTLGVVESPDPTGVLVSAGGGGSGTAVVNVGGFDHDFTDGDSAIVTVGSLTTDVLAGTVEIHLAVDLFLIVPAGTKAIVTVNPTDFLVECQGASSITVDKNGTQSTIAPGNSQTVASDFADLTMAENPGAGGDTTPAPGTTSVDRGVAQPISTTVTSGYRLSGWTASPAGNAVFGNSAATATTVTLSGDATVTANYVQEFQLTVVVSGDGTVTSSPAGIDCGGDCSEIYAIGTSVTLTPAAGTGYVFSGWTGDADCTDGTVVINSAVSCTATFIPGDRTLTVTTIGGGSGTVKSSPAGIDCGADCTGSYANGTTVTLTAHPSPRSLFAGWSGDADCSDGSVTMNTDVSCTAGFSVLGDWNIDGTPDMVWRNPDTGMNALLYLKANAKAGIDFIVSAPTDWELAAAADLDDDGLMDLIFRNKVTGLHIVAYFDGKTYRGFKAIPFKKDPWKLCGTGDHNNDGKPDLFWTNPTTGENEVVYLVAGAEVGSDSLPKAPLPWKVVAIDDFNGDGVLDLVARNGATGMLAAGYLDGTNLKGVGIMPTAPLSQEVCGTMDLNLDGKPDIVLRDPVTGKNEAWYMDGTKRMETMKLPTAPPPWSGMTGYK